MKVSIIGAGNVGATAAMKIANDNYVNDIVLLDVREGVAEGKAMDIMQSIAMLDMNVTVSGTTADYSKTANSDIIIITSGVPRKPGMTREELVGVNANVMDQVLEGTTKYSPNAKYIVVSNPMDTMTQMVVNKLGTEEAYRVMGMGGMLDSARFRYYIWKTANKHMPVVMSNIVGTVIGGHGDTTMIPLVNMAKINGQPIKNILTPAEIEEVVNSTMKGGATLTKMLGTSAWEAPAEGINQMVKAIAFDENIEIPCSVYRPKFELCIGSLAYVGRDGVQQAGYEDLDNMPEFIASVEAVRKVNEALNKGC